MKRKKGPVSGQPDLECLTPGQEFDIWRFAGLKFLGSRITAKGKIAGTGPLGFLLRPLRLVIAAYLQNKWSLPFKDLARWKGKRVANLMYPPIGSSCHARTKMSVLKSHFGRPTPSAVTFAVTYRCPCGCFHCSAKPFHRADAAELSTAEARDVIDQCLDMGVSNITFTGGEPLLREDVFDLIAYVDKKKAITSLFTNGRLLDERAVRRLKEAGLYTLFVSLDSDSADEHDRLRRSPGLFQAAVEGIQRAQKNGLLVGLSSYCGRTNVERGHHVRMHRLARQLGLLTVLLFDAVPTGNLLKNTEEMLTDAQHKTLSDYTTSVFRDGLGPPLASQSWQNSLEGYLSGIGCFAGFIQCYISAYGDVSPCDFTPLSFGNLRQERLRRVWRRMTDSPPYNRRSLACRMQDMSFRNLFIDPIPQGAKLPYPAKDLPAAGGKAPESLQRD
jgi:MoaA/NifB/PqqE/SkfB family radical SAM enzyme